MYLKISIKYLEWSYSNFVLEPFLITSLLGRVKHDILYFHLKESFPAHTSTSRHTLKLKYTATKTVCLCKQQLYINCSLNSNKQNWIIWKKSSVSFLITLLNSTNWINWYILESKVKKNLKQWQVLMCSTAYLTIKKRQMKCVQLNSNTQIKDYLTSSQGGEKALKNTWDQKDGLWSTVIYTVQKVHISV